PIMGPRVPTVLLKPFLCYKRSGAAYRNYRKFRAGAFAGYKSSRARVQAFFDASGENSGLFHAIVQRHSAIRIAAEEQTWMPPRPLFDPGDAFQVAEVILRDRLVPADDLMKR